MLRIPVPLVLLGLLAPAALGQVSVNWGTAIIPQKMVLSDGTTGFDPNVFGIEFGAFDPVFTPTMANISDWAANWKTFDAAHILVKGAGVTARFAGTDTLEVGQTSQSPDATPAAQFNFGEPAYVWVFNQKTVDETSEWALYTRTGTGEWEFPTVTGDPQSPVNWFLSGADTAIVGAVNGGSGAGGATGGGFTDDTSTDFVIRTHRIMTVPEPGVAGLSVLATLLFGVRRKR